MMKKVKTNGPRKNSKISDFFGKAPDNKRKLSDVESEGTVLSNVVNLPQKDSQSISPNGKKIKQDENCTSYKNNHEPVQDMCHKAEFLNSNGQSNFNINSETRNYQEITPKKYMKPSSSMRTPTPQKNSDSCMSDNKNRNPQISKKGTPVTKLFDRSPRKLEEFNVHVLEDFIKLSPSKTSKIVKKTSTPSKGGNMQSDIVQNISPSSEGSTPIQNYNETTPSKSQRHLLKAVSPRNRAKLKFSENIKKSNSNKMVDNSEYISNEELNSAFDNLLNDEFSDMMVGCNKLFFDEPQYCKILKVDESAKRTVLRLESNKSGKVGVCNVEDFWSNSRFKAGDRIYVAAEKTSNNEWVVNNQAGFVVYEPDLLISCTSVVSSLFCKRKSVLAERYRGFEPSNRSMIVGVLVHTLLQSVLKHKLKSKNEIETLLKNILKSESNVRRLYESNLTLNDIESELLTFIPKITQFVGQYMNSRSTTTTKDWKGKICGIDDIEENLWCQELGIKGKIDVTIRTESDTKPLEIKTGRATVSLEHRGQVMLYIMMMNKFGYQVSSGLLLYLREGVLKEIKTTPQEKRDVMILRNELAYYLTRNVRKNDAGEARPPELPEPISHHSACAKCPYNVICTSQLKFEDYDLSKNKNLLKVQNDVTSHLSETHLNYFIHWSTLLSMEQGCGSGSKNLHEIYTLEPAKREKQGRSIIYVKVVYVGSECNGLLEHTFEKENSDNSINLVTYGIMESNYVVVSTAKRPAVAAGFVTDVSSSSITIALDRDLNMKYRGKIFHLDTYDSSITQSFNLTSLALLLEETSRAAELRNIIIDKTPPTFSLKLPSVVAKKGVPILKRLNRVQQKAVLKALSAKDFLLIKGMPGTGKTATIVALVQLLVELNKTVLITSHTHAAVDNICVRLLKHGVDFIRLGSSSRIDANVKSKSESVLTKGCTTPEQLEEVYNSFKVIAVTCLGSGHPLLSKRTVDICLVDESTQVLQPSAIKPLYAAKTFILIGDPDQLPPVVRNRDAINAGMSESLFERLSNPDGTITLNLNYRMNKTITDLANTLTYNGQLQAANDAVAKSSLKIPNIKMVKTTYQEHPWLLKALNTSLEAAVQIIDTGPVWQLPQDVGWLSKNSEFKDNSDSQSYINVHEAAIVATLVNALIKGGVTNTDIGVMATYRAQVGQISALLSKTAVDVSTVDQFQGRDKNVIIYSCAKSKDVSVTSDSQKFELLEDKRRLTVAITRAKHKLLIVGDLSTLRNYSTFSVISKALEKNVIEFDSKWAILNDF